MTTLEEVFEQFKQIPDWQLYPMPEVFYEKFNVKKPKPVDFRETIHYTPPPYQSLNVNGKVEERPPLPGGVREIKDLQQLPVEVKKTNEETGELEDYPTPDPDKIKSALARITYPTQVDVEKYMLKYDDIFKSQNVADTLKDFQQTMLSLPTIRNRTETQPESDPPSQGPSCASPDSAPSAPCRDAECSPPSQQPQSESSSHDQNQTEIPLSISSQAFRF